MQKKILIIESNYYVEISKKLLDSVIKCLEEKRFKYEIITVPGALEIPVVLEKFKNEYLGFVILGCVIRGETSHFDIVKNLSMTSVYGIVNKNQIAAGTAILTVENMAQAMDRADINKRNLGENAANVCLKMIEILGKS